MQLPFSNIWIDIEARLTSFENGTGNMVSMDKKNIKGQMRYHQSYDNGCQWSNWKLSDEQENKRYLASFDYLNAKFHSFDLCLRIFHSYSFDA